MGTLWFWIIAAMIATYVVLDGFDLGAGVIYLIAAKTNDERRRVQHLREMHSRVQDGRSRRVEVAGCQRDYANAVDGEVARSYDTQRNDAGFCSAVRRVPTRPVEPGD